MEENNQNNEKISTDAIKKEAVDTANQVKETLKNTDLKKDANEAKGFVSNFFKNPINEIENVVNSSKNQFLKIAIIVLVVWLVAVLVDQIITTVSYYTSYSSSLTIGTFFNRAFSNVLSLVKAVVAPVLSVVVISAISYFMSKDKKHSFIQTATSVVMAKIPVVIAAVVSLLDVIGSQVYKITGPFSGFCSIISVVLLYFTLKSLNGEKEDNTFMKKFAIIMGIFYVAKFIINFFGINI